MCEMCNLMGLAEEDITKAQDPRKPWAKDPILVAFPSWETRRDEMENWMLDNGLGDYLIDEIALLFRERPTMGEFVWDAVKSEGVKLFNTSHDRVHTHPFKTDYEVNYAFLETPATFRVECMNICGGFSPLHAAMESHMDEYSPAVVHMSFKLETMDQYEDVCVALNRAEDCEPVQTCVSTYGQFSYWNIMGRSGVYLKPRVNLRDSLYTEVDPPSGEEPWEKREDGPEAFADERMPEDRGHFGMPGLGHNVNPFNEEK